MRMISYSVGKTGINIESDVKTVQALLNRHLDKKVNIDGLIGGKTIYAINKFQSQYVNMRHPDGRVDPKGKTIHYLRKHQLSNPLLDGSTNHTKVDSNNNEISSLRKKYVASNVKELPITKDLINKLIQELNGIRFKIISGYLSDSDQFWKVNYHWEYLVWMLDHSLTLNIPRKDKAVLQSLRAILLDCAPNPVKGYRTSPVGKPSDLSGYPDIKKRYYTLREKKKEFKKLIIKLKIKSKSNKSATSFDLAVAPISFPGSSKHGTGYALDISGNRSAIKTKCRALGASLIFDEKSHVHVEFKSGIKST